VQENSICFQVIAKVGKTQVARYIAKDSKILI